MRDFIDLAVAPALAAPALADLKSSAEFALKSRFVAMKGFIAAVAAAILVGPLGIKPAVAQSVQAPYALQYESRVTVRMDRTATDVFTQRLKILTPSAIATVGQQQLTFVEGMQPLRPSRLSPKRAMEQRCRSVLPISLLGTPPRGCRLSICVI
jgi:hypothetical protein